MMEGTCPCGGPMHDSIIAQLVKQRNDALGLLSKIYGIMVGDGWGDSDVTTYGAFYKEVFDETVEMIAKEMS